MTHARSMRAINMIGKNKDFEEEFVFCKPTVFQVIAYTVYNCGQFPLLNKKPNIKFKVITLTVLPLFRGSLKFLGSML